MGHSSQPSPEKDMGNIITFIKTLQDRESSFVDEKFAIFLDFEGTFDQDDDLSKDLEEKLATCTPLLEFLSTYSSGGRLLIQEANKNSGDEEMAEKAWTTMVPVVNQLLELKNATDDLNQLVPKILALLWSKKEGRTSSAHVNLFKQYASLIIQLGRILDIDMKIDALKISAPSVPNDISYVKRQSTIRQKNHKANAIDQEFAETLSMQNLESLSMYYINPTPALNNIIGIITKFFNDEESQDGPLELIVSFCKVCIKTLDSDIRNKFQRIETLETIQRIMVATALLYDHLAVGGVFVKESPINIRAVVEILEIESGMKRRRVGSRGVNSESDISRREELGSTEQAKNLLSVLKYSNKHLRDPTTPKNVEQMFNKIY